MLTNRFALYAPADDGATGDGAAGGDDESHQDKDVVPKSQMIAAINSATEKMERALAAQASAFEARLAAATAKPVEPPKEYTRADLNAMVEAGQINQAQADAQIEMQTIAKAEARAELVARETVQRTQRTESVSSQIDQYTALLPELRDVASETYRKVKGEFDFLVANGSDRKSLATELAAIRAAFGPIDQVTKARSGRPSHDSSRETGDGGAGPKGGEGNLKLTARQREYYESGIKAGRYKDWTAVGEELKYAKARA